MIAPWTSFRRDYLYHVAVLQLVLLAQTHLRLAVDGKEEAFPNIGMHPERKIVRRAARFMRKASGSITPLRSVNLLSSSTG